MLAHRCVAPGAGAKAGLATPWSRCSNTRHACAPTCCRLQRRAGSRALPLVVCGQDTRKTRAQERHRRLRRKLRGTKERPRLAVYRSNHHIYVQVIDDEEGRTLASASTQAADVQAAMQGSAATKDAAQVVGAKIAEACSKLSISAVCFDRGGRKYHGRVQALAEAARAGGLAF